MEKLHRKFPELLPVMIEIILDWSYSRESCSVLKPQSTTLQNPANQPLGLYNTHFPTPPSLNLQRGNFTENSEPKEETTLMDANRTRSKKDKRKLAEFPLRTVTFPPPKRPRAGSLQLDLERCRRTEAKNRSHVISLLSRLLAENSEKFPGILAGQILVRVTSVVDGDPFPEQYSDILPRKAGFGRDNFVEKAFEQNPILFDMMEMIARSGKNSRNFHR